MQIFPPHACDFYKTGHIYQYTPGTQQVYSNFTARAATHAAMPKDWDGKTVFFGLQAMVKWFLLTQWDNEFFCKPKDKVVARYQRRMDTALGPGVVTAEHIAALARLGLPAHHSQGAA
jgi:nicotinamide phosphoribosyltransferase